VPAGLSWALLGAALGWLPGSDAALILIPAYALFYGLAEARGLVFPAPPGTTWQVPSAWVLNTPRWRRTMIWGSLLGPGFATRNPYAGFGFLVLAVAAAGGLRHAVLLAAAIGVAHGTGRAAALLRGLREADGGSYLRSMMRSMYWRAFDGYALLAVAGLSVTVCLHHFWLYIPATRSSGTGVAGSAMWLGVLGRLSIRDKDAEIRISAPKQRVVLAALLRRANQVVSLDELAEVLWDSTPPPTARVTLRNHVKSLRQVLGPAVSARIVTLPPGYLIDLREPELDLLRFASLCAAGAEAVRAQRWDHADASLTEALALWRGSPLADVPSEVLRRDEIPRLEQLRLQALEYRIDAALRLGRHAHVIPELRVLVAQHRMRERFHGQLMLALYQSGQQAEALAVYRVARQMLVGELGVEPGPALRQLHQAILAGAAELSASLPEPPAPMRVMPAQVPAGISDFVGRESQLAALSSALDAASGETAVAAVVGGPGVGKTTLAVTWAHQAAGKFPDGQLYVNLRGFDPSGRPVTPTEAIQGFLDALQVPAASVPAGLPARAALYRSLTAGRRMLVLLDNARDSDQVRPLLPGSPGCLVLVTSRSELPGLVAAEGARALRLGVFSDAEALELLVRRIGSARVAAEPEVARELTRLCARLPLALAIIAARVIARPGFPLASLAEELRDGGGRLDALATGEQTADIREVFSWSYRCLRPPAARMFLLLGLYPGPDITVAAAARLAATTPREARGLLRELTRCHVLAELSPGRYALHELLRAYAAERARAEEVRSIARSPNGRGALPLAVGERPVVEVRFGQDVALLLVLQQVGPRLAITLFEQDVLCAHDVAGVEVLRIAERPQPHVRVLGSQGRDHHGGAFVPHGGQQAAYQVAYQVHAQGPAVPEVAEDVGHVRHAADHDAAPRDAFGEVDRFAVDGERHITEH